MKLGPVIRDSVPRKSNRIISSPVNQVSNDSNAINVDPHRLMVRNCQTNLMHTFFMKLELWLIKVIIFTLASVRQLVQWCTTL